MRKIGEMCGMKLKCNHDVTRTKQSDTTGRDGTNDKQRCLIQTFQSHDSVTTSIFGNSLLTLYFSS